MKASTNVRHIVLPCSSSARSQLIPDIIRCYSRFVVSIVHFTLYNIFRCPLQVDLHFSFFPRWDFFWFSGGRTIIFTETKDSASQLSGLLPGARPLHGDIQQSQREVRCLCSYMVLYIFLILFRFRWLSKQKVATINFFLINADSPSLCFI